MRRLATVVRDAFAGRPYAEERAKLDISLRQWALYHHREIVYANCRWFGTPALKNPLDAWIYQEIIHEVRPKVFVELGTDQGGGAKFLAHMLDLVGQPYVGPLPAIDDFLRAHPEFEADRRRERYIYTFNPRGYLRRRPIVS